MKSTIAGTSQIWRLHMAVAKKLAVSGVFLLEAM
jgi:hypothetical protein